MAARATSRESHSSISSLELLDPALAVAARLPVPAPRRLELLLQPLRIRLGSAARTFSSSPRLVFMAIDLGRSSLDLAFELGAVLAQAWSASSPWRQLLFQDGGVGDQALGDIEAQERLDGRPQHLAAGLILGQRADLLRVEEEELRDLQREEVLDELAPVLGVPAVGQAIEREPGAPRGPCPPCTVQERRTS